MCVMLPWLFGHQGPKKSNPWKSFHLKRTILLNSLINSAKYALTHGPEKLAQAWAEYSDIWWILIKMALTILFNVSLKSKCVNHKP